MRSEPMFKLFINTTANGLRPEVHCRCHGHVVLLITVRSTHTVTPVLHRLGVSGCRLSCLQLKVNMTGDVQSALFVVKQANIECLVFQVSLMGSKLYLIKQDYSCIKRWKYLMSSKIIWMSRWNLMKVWLFWIKCLQYKVKCVNCAKDINKEAHNNKYKCLKVWWTLTTD